MTPGGEDSEGCPRSVIVAGMTQVLADGYRRFAELEAAGVSEIYFDWATGIADDPAVLDLIAALPGIKRQPNLVFAAARFLGAPAGPYSDFRDWLIEHWEAVIPVIMVRSTQTNEAARCAVLLPVLEQLDGPLALILDPPMSLGRPGPGWSAGGDVSGAGVSSGRRIPVVHVVLGRAAVAAVVRRERLVAARA